MTKADSRCATCLHSAKAHRRADAACSFDWAWTAEHGWYDGTGEACTCDHYIQHVKDPAKVKRGKQSAKRGAKAELRVEAETGERKRGGPGNADNGRNETKVMTQQIRGYIEEALRHGGDRVYI